MEQQVLDSSLIPGVKASKAASPTSARPENEAVSHPDGGAGVSLKKRRVSLSPFATWGMGKSAVVSVMLHATIVASMIACFAGAGTKHPETITVFLTENSPPGERGFASKAPARADIKRSAPVTKASSHPRPESAAAETLKPSVPKTESEPPRGRVAPAEYSSLSAPPVEQPVPPGPGDAVGGQGRQERTQAGSAHARGDASGTVSGAGHADYDGADGGKNQYLARNFAYIRDLIVKNLKYPYDARRMGWRGSVTITFVILENGGVEALRITRSSGHDLLDQSVVNAVRTLQPFPRPPKRAELVIPIAFRLE
jgi:protein TonB